MRRASRRVHRGTHDTSYVFSGDLNADGGTSNDLIYIPRDVSEMNFQTFTQGARTYTAAEQAAAWDAYIEQDDYLREHRGEYAQRGAVFLPLVNRLDFTRGPGPVHHPEGPPSCVPVPRSTSSTSATC